MSLLESYLLPSFSNVVEWLSYALLQITTYESRYTVFVFLRLGDLTEDFFYPRTIHLPANLKMSLIFL